MQLNADKKASKFPKKAWKRLSLREVSLFSMFESLQQENYANFLKNTLFLSRPAVDTQSVNQKLYAWIDELNLCEHSSLLKAFHVLHYLYNVEAVESNSIRDEVIFQDFSAALAMYSFITVLLIILKTASWMSRLL